MEFRETYEYIGSVSIYIIMNRKFEIIKISSYLYYSVPCTLPKTFRQSCSDKIENFRQIYNFLASNDDTTKLLRRFRLWPIIFVPRSQDVGDFLFVERTFWNDPSTLLSSQDTVSDPNGRLPIQSYYEDNSKLNSLFLDILQVPLHPTIDDYIPLLLINQDINKIWQIIAIITKIAIEQNKQKEVRGIRMQFQKKNLVITFCLFRKMCRYCIYSMHW